MFPLPKLIGGSVLHCFYHNSMQSLLELFWGSVIDFFTRCHHDALSSFKLLHIFVWILSQFTTQAQHIAHNTFTRAFGLSSSKPYTLIGSTWAMLKTRTPTRKDVKDLISLTANLLPWPAHILFWSVIIAKLCPLNDVNTPTSFRDPTLIETTRYT